MLCVTCRGLSGSSINEDTYLTPNQSKQKNNYDKAALLKIDHDKTSSCLITLKRDSHEDSTNNGNSQTVTRLYKRQSEHWSLNIDLENEWISKQ